MDYILHVMVIVVIYSLLACSLDLVVGYAGIPSLGHAAFCLIGAYASSLLAVRLDVNPWLGIVAGACLATLAGAGVALPVVRLHGDYVALSTLGLGVMVNVVIRNWTSITGGPFGVGSIPPLSLLGHPIDDPGEVLIVYIFLSAWLGFMLRQLVVRPFGRVLKSIRDDEKASQALGKDVALFKLKALLVSSFMAGFGGALYAHYVTFIDASSFDTMDSLALLLMTILGGAGTLTGPVLGAIFIISFPEVLRFSGIPSTVAPNLEQIIYGVSLTALMLFRPKGIMGDYELGSAR